MKGEKTFQSEKGGIAMADRETLKKTIEQYKKETGRTNRFICAHVNVKPSHLSRFLKGDCGMNEDKQKEVLDFVLFDTQAYRRAEEEWIKTNNWGHLSYDEERN